MYTWSEEMKRELMKRELAIPKGSVKMPKERYWEFIGDNWDDHFDSLHFDSVIELNEYEELKNIEGITIEPRSGDEYKFTVNKGNILSAKHIRIIDNEHLFYDALSLLQNFRELTPEEVEEHLDKQVKRTIRLATTLSTPKQVTKCITKYQKDLEVKRWGVMQHYKGHYNLFIVIDTTAGLGTKFMKSDDEHVIDIEITKEMYEIYKDE